MGDDLHHSLTPLKSALYAASQKFHVLLAISQFLQAKNFLLHCFVPFQELLFCPRQRSLGCFWSWSPSRNLTLTCRLASWLDLDLTHLTWPLDLTCLMIWTLTSTWLPSSGLSCLSCSDSARLWFGQRGTSPAESLVLLSSSSLRKQLTITVPWHT